MRTLPLSAGTAALLLAATTLLGQEPGPAPIMRGLRFDAGLLTRGGGPGSAAFGLAADLTPPRLPGLLRLGLSTWSGGTAATRQRGRDVSLLWLARSHQHGTIRARVFAGAGPAIVAERAVEGTHPARVHPALGAEAGFGVPLGIRDALTLELSGASLVYRSGPPHVAARLGLRLGPGIRAFLRGEAPPPPTPAVVQTAAPPDIEDVAAVAGGLLVNTSPGSGLQLATAAFDSAGALTRDASRQLSRAGGALRRLGLGPVHVQIYARDSTTDSRLHASERAVAVARALARGGYPAERIQLEVALPGADNPAAGRVVAVSCAGPCTSKASRRQ